MLTVISLRQVKSGRKFQTIRNDDPNSKQIGKQRSVLVSTSGCTGRTLDDRRALRKGDTARVSMKSDNIKDVMLLTKEELERQKRKANRIKDPSLHHTDHNVKILV